MNSLSTKAVAAITLFTLGIGMGWAVKGWKVGYNEAKAIAAQIAQFNRKIEEKNENITLVDVAAADLGRVRLRLQTCKADLDTTAQAIARAGQLFEKREDDLREVERRIKSDAIEADLFLEDLRARL